jgi:VanZ family protein
MNSYLPFFHRFFPQMESFNWGHFIAYYVLAITIYWGLGRMGWTWKGKLLVVILCCLYGITDEYHQSFTSDRTPDLADLRNDTIGATIAMMFVSIGPIQRWINKPRM